MNVLVDTSVWSLALRRPTTETKPHVMELRRLIDELRAEIIGPIRQEILSGVRNQTQFETLRATLQAYADLALESDDYERAAEFFNACRQKGVQGSNTDFLICAAAQRRGLAIFTTDQDFSRFVAHLPIRLHAVRKNE